MGAVSIGPPFTGWQETIRPFRSFWKSTTRGPLVTGVMLAETYQMATSIELVSSA
jgi:hypothetical protein